MKIFYNYENPDDTIGYGRRGYNFPTKDGQRLGFTEGQQLGITVGEAYFTDYIDFLRGNTPDPKSYIFLLWMADTLGDKEKFKQLSNELVNYLEKNPDKVSTIIAPRSLSGISGRGNFVVGEIGQTKDYVLIENYRNKDLSLKKLVKFKMIFPPKPGSIFALVPRYYNKRFIVAREDDSEIDVEIDGEAYHVLSFVPFFSAF